MEEEEEEEENEKGDDEEAEEDESPPTEEKRDGFDFPSFEKTESEEVKSVPVPDEFPAVPPKRGDLPLVGPGFDMVHQQTKK